MEISAWSISFGILQVGLTGLVIAFAAIFFTWTNARFKKLEEGQAKLEEGQAKLEGRLDKLESKMDQILIALKKT